MTVGNVLNPSRPRFEENERLDVVDAEALSRSAREHYDAVSKSVLITPKATAAAPVGLVLTGGSVSTPLANILRIGSELLVAVDADGRVLVKPNGTTLDVAIPADGSIYNIYAYYLEDPTELARRRFISVTAPYTESPASIETKYAASVGLHVKSGVIVASDVVNGETKALVYLHSCHNIAGVVTITPYDFLATNKLSTLPPAWAAVAPTVPTNNYTNSSAKTLHELQMLQAWQHARTKYGKAGAWMTQYLPGTSVAPDAANNWGAWKEPRRGLDAVDRSQMPVVTIGDGVNTFGDFDLNRYASGDLCLAAAFASIASIGGTIAIRPGVFPTLAADVTFGLGLGRSLHLISEIGDGFTGIVCGSHKIVVTGNVSEFWADDLFFAGAGTVLDVRTMVVRVHRCTFTMSAGGGDTAMIKNPAGTHQVAIVEITDCRFDGTGGLGAAHDNTLTAFVDFSGYEMSNFHLERCLFVASGFGRNFVSINVGADVQVVGCDFQWLADTADIGAPTLQPAFLYLTTTGTATKQRGRIVERCSFRGSHTNAADSNFSGVRVSGVSYMTVAGCFFDHCKTGVFFDGIAQVYNRVLGCTASLFGATNFTTCRGIYGTCDLSEFEIANCTFSLAGGGGVVWASLGTIFALSMSQCTFDASPLLIGANNINGCTFDHNTFIGLNGSLAPFIWGVTKIKTFTWSNNLHTGFANSTTNDTYFGLRVQGGSIIGATIENNHFANLQNVTFTGGTTWIPRIIEIDTDLPSGVVVRGNVASDIANTLTGALSVVPTFIEVESYDRVTVPVVDGGSVIIEDNTIGPDSISGIGTSRCALAVLGASSKFYLSKLVIRGNVTTGIFNTPGGAEPGWTDTCFGVHIILATDAAGYLSIEDNEFCISNNTGGDITGSFFKFIQFSAATWVRATQICHNTFRLLGVQKFTANYGILSQWNYVDLIFKDNIAVCGNGATNPVMTYNIASAGVRSITRSLPTFGGGSSPAPDNLGFQSNEA